LDTTEDRVGPAAPAAWRIGGFRIDSSSLID